MNLYVLAGVHKCDIPRIDIGSYHKALTGRHDLQYILTWNNRSTCGMDGGPVNIACLGRNEICTRKPVLRCSEARLDVSKLCLCVREILGDFLMAIAFGLCDLQLDIP